MMSVRAVLLSLACASIVRRSGEENPMAFEATPSGLVETVQAEKGKEELSPLRWVGDKAKLAMLKLKGPEFAKTDAGTEAVKHAARKGYVASMQWLKENGAEMDGAVQEAADYGQIDALDWLKGNGGDLNSMRHGKRPVHDAAQEGDLEILEWLRANGADMQATDHIDDDTVVHEAAFWGKLNVLKWLKDHGFDLATKSKFDGETAAHKAAWMGHLHILKWLEKNGVDLAAKDRHGNTVLHEAAGHASDGQLKTLKWLVLEKKFDVNEADALGQTLAMDLAGNANLKPLKWLAEQGADLLAKDRLGKTAADHAAQFSDHGPKYRKVVKWLVEEKKVPVQAETGAVLLETETESQESQEYTEYLSDCTACVNFHNWAADKVKLAFYKLKGEWFAQTPSGVDAMHYAAKKGHLDTLAWLVEHGADVNAKSKVYGESAVHMAAEFGQVDVLEFLKANGADMDAKDKMFDNQAVHNAAGQGQIEVLEWLKDSGADLQAKGSWGNTAAHRAAGKGQLASLKWLEKNGANLQATNDVGDTLIHDAAYGHHRGSIAVLEWLVKEKGFDVNAEDKYGNRPIHTCGWAGDKEVVDWLEQNGADLNAKNKYGHTASDKAARDGKWEMLQYLVDEKGIELGAYETFGR